MDFGGFFRQIFNTFKLNVDFLLSNISGNHILFLDKKTFPNETWHVVRTFVSLQSCVWGMSKAENCSYGGHTNLRYEKNNKIVYIFLAILDIGSPNTDFYVVWWRMKTQCNLCPVSKWLLEKHENVKDMLLIIKLIITCWGVIMSRKGWQLIHQILMTICGRFGDIRVKISLFFVLSKMH